MSELNQEDLDSEEGKQMIRLITDRVLQMQGYQSIDELHPEDAELHLETTYNVLLASLDLSDEMKSFDAPSD